MHGKLNWKYAVFAFFFLNLIGYKSGLYPEFKPAHLSVFSLKERETQQYTRNMPAVIVMQV